MLLRNNSVNCSHPFATNWPAGVSDIEFAKALTCAQERKEYFYWKMEYLCDERYNHLLPGHPTDDPEEIDDTEPS